jgi:hypothetical protein
MIDNENSNPEVDESSTTPSIDSDNQEENKTEAEKVPEKEKTPEEL